MGNLRRAATLATTTLTLLTATVTLAPGWLTAQAAEAALQAASQPAADQQAAATSASTPTSSLSLTLTAAQIPAKPHTTATPTLNINPNESSVLAVGIRPLAILDRTSGSVAPALTIVLPTGVRILNVIDDLDPGVTGSWACKGSGTVTCSLLESDGTPGRIPNNRLAQALLVVSAPTLAITGKSIGTIAVRAAATAPNPKSVVGEITQTSNIAVAIVKDVPPAVLVRAVPVQSGPTANKISVRTILLSQLESTDPSVAIDSLVPSGSIGIAVTAPGWSCTTGDSASCVTTKALKVGGISDIDASFVAPGTDDHIHWTIQDSISGGQFTKGGKPGEPQVSAPIVTGLAMDQMRAKPDPAHFIIEMRSPRGQGITQGGAENFSIFLRNASRSSYSPTVTIELPAGLSATETENDWTCTGTSTLTCEGPKVKGRETVRMPLKIKAVADAPTGQADVKVSVTPGGDKGFVHPIFISDAGDPVAGVVIRKIVHNDARGWGNGALLTARVGLTTQYRVLIPNIGGARLREGKSVTFSQEVGAGAQFTAITGEGCAITQNGAKWVCHTTAQQTVKSGEVIAGATVSFVAARPAVEVPFGRVRAIVDNTQKQPSYRGVNFRAAHPKLPLRVITRLEDGITAGGNTVVKLQVADKSTAAKVHGIKVTGTLPAGITSGAITENGWTCEAGDNVSCTYAPVLKKSSRTSLVTVPLIASVGAKPGVRSIAWSANGVSPDYAKGSVRARLAVFPSARVQAEAVPNVIGQRALGGHASRVVLRAVNSTPGLRVWKHRWEQVCLTQHERDVIEQCQGVRTEAVKILSPKREITSVLIPVNAADKSYVFRVRASDAHSHFDRFVKVRAAGAINRARVHRLPQVDARTGFAPTAYSDVAREPVAPTMATANLISPANVTPVTAHRVTHVHVTPVPRNSNLSVSIAGGALQIVRNGAKVTLDTAVSGASGAVTYAWQQIVGTAPALSSTTTAKPTFTVPKNTRVITYQVTVTDSSGATAIDTVTYALNPTVTTQFCSLYNKAAGAVSKAADAAAKLSTALSDQINAVFNQLHMINDACNSDSGFTFSGTNLSFGGFKITGASGMVSAAGIAISAGSLTSPAGWGLPEMNLSNAGLVIAFVGTTAADVTMSGSFTMSNFAFFPLPGGWSGKTKVSFVASAGNTTVAIAANSSDPGGATATFSGNVSTSGSFNATVTANDLVKIGGAGVDATGTVAYSSASGISGSVTGSLTGTATLVDGVTVPTLNIAWKPGASPAISARGTVAFAYGSSGNSITVNATIAYTSTTEWTATVTGGGTAAWQPVPGLSIQPSDFTGTFAEVKGELQWALDVNVSQAWSPTPALTISGLDISLANACPKAISDQVTCPTADVFLSVTGNATVNAEPVDSFTVDALAVIGLGGGGGFVLSATGAGSINIADGLALTDASLVVSYQAPQQTSGPAVSASVEGGYSIDLNGNMVISGVGDFSHLQASVTSDGWSFAGYTQGIPFGSSGQYGEMTQSIVAYSTLPSTITPPTSYGIPPLTYVACQGNQPAPTGQVCTGTLYVSGTYAAPTWFTQAVNTGSIDAVATIEIDPTNGTFDSQVTFNIGGGGLSVPTGGSSDLAIQSLYFSLNATETNLVVTAGGLINLGLPSGYGAAPPQLNLFMQYDLASNTVSGGFTATNWNDAFGLSGFDMQSLTVALQINLNTMTPGLALSGTALLPESMNSVLSVPNAGVPITAFVDLSLDTPCLGVDIGTQGANEPTALSIGGGVLTASFVSLYIAPAGCQIGNTTYQPGYSLDFDGAVLGVGVEVSASMSFTPNLIFQTNIDIASFQVGPLTMDQTTLAINVDEGVSDSVAFSGGFSLFGTEVTASGSMSYVNATSTTTAALDINTNGFDIAGFQLQNANVTLNVTSTPADTNISFSATADMAILGDTLDINQMSFTVENNVITQVTADVTTTLQLGGAIDFDGAFYLNYTASPESFQVAADVNVTSAGYTLGSGSLSISPSCADVSATLDVGGFINASVDGYVIYGANCTVTDAITGVTQSISGDSGAFCVAVDNVSLDLGVFNASGSANLSNNGDTTCAGTSTASNTMVGSVAATLVLGTQDFNNTVNVNGQFSGDGDFSFTGSDTLNIGGFNLQMQVAAANTGSGASVSGSADFSLLGNDLTFAGSWNNEDGVPSTTLTASVNFNLGGWNLGSGDVYLWQTASNYGMTFNMDLNAGIAQMQSTLTFNQVDGQVLFYTYVSFDLGIPGVASVGASGSFTNCATSACQSVGDYVLTASASLDVGGWTYYSPPFTIDLGGQFGFSVSAGQSNQSTATVNILGVNWWTANDWWSTALAVNQDGFTANAGGSATIYSQEVALQYPCGPWYWVFEDWCSYGVTDWGAIGAKASINPWSFCFQAFGSPWICL